MLDAFGTEPDPRRRLLADICRETREGGCFTVASHETVMARGVREALTRRGCRLIRHGPQVWIVEWDAPSGSAARSAHVLAVAAGVV